MGGLGEAKNLDFCTFFGVFSMLFLKRVLERPKNEKNDEQEGRRPDLGAGPAECAEPGGEIERG